MRCLLVHNNCQPQSVAMGLQTHSAAHPRHGVHVHLHTALTSRFWTPQIEKAAAALERVASDEALSNAQRNAALLAAHAASLGLGPDAGGETRSHSLAEHCCCRLMPSFSPLHLMLKTSA